MADYPSPYRCNHEPDPATIEYDGKHGRRARCKLCGADLVLTRRIEPGSGKRETSRERRERKRKMMEAEQ